MAGSLIPIAWDTETDRFGPGSQAPPLACVSYCSDKGRGLLDRFDAEDFLEEILYDEKYLLIGHNIAYDLAVVAAEFPRFLPAIFRAYEQGRVSDTMIRQKLLDISIGRFRGYRVQKTSSDYKADKTEIAKKKSWRWIQHNYSLDDCYHRAKHKRLDKDTWRTRYGEFRDVPLANWPAGAQKYALDDAVATWDVYLWQEELNKKIQGKFQTIKTHITNADPLADEKNQCMGAWWMHLMKTWGIRTNPARVYQLRQEIDLAYNALEKSLKEVGLIKPDGVRDTKRAKARMIAVMGGLEKCRLTDKGQVSLAEEACKSSGDMILQDYAELGSLKVVKSKDIKELAKGCLLPIHSNFDSLIATGRSSSAGPNIQNIRRLPGIRECFVPRKGMVFLDADYDGLELRTLAQVCLHLLGESKLADVLNSGGDPHLHVAATLLGISYEEAKRRYADGDEEVDTARQLGKVANFGFSGGLGFETFCYFANKQLDGITLTEHDARKLKGNWLKAFPEMEKYFHLIDSYCREDAIEGTAFIKQIFSNRIRGGVPYTVACNSLFQGLGSDATKAAGFLIAKACYLDRNSPLYGCRVVNYIHDQFIVECPIERCHEAAFELARLMVLGAKPYLPDVPPTVKKPLATMCWSKKAKQVWKDGKLIPWDEKFEVQSRDKRKKVA